MPFAAHGGTSKLDALVKILLQEREKGYDDTTVMGGLDKFLQRWKSELKDALSGAPSYRQMTSQQRAEWVQSVLSQSQIPEQGISNARKTSPQKNVRQKGVESKPKGISLDDDISRLKGVTSSNVARFKRLGLESVRDMMYLFPRRHNDFANIRKIADLVPGQEQTVVASVWEASEVRLGGRLRSAQAILGDETGNVRVVWFNQPYLAKAFHSGDTLVISGKVGVFNGRKVFESPEYELLKGQEELLHTGRLVPVYPSVEGLPQRTIRRVVSQSLKLGLPQTEELLPADLVHRIGLINLRGAIQQMHYPDDEPGRQLARRRLAFDELFLMQLALLSRKKMWQQEGEAVAVKADAKLLAAFLGGLPFVLTGAQQKVMTEILGDMDSSRPMSRLLQGDVGSGKTVVALAALLVTAMNGRQGAFMAPTEILAEQHFISFSKILSSLARPLQKEYEFSAYVDQFPRPISIALLLGSQSRKIKGDVHKRVAEGHVDIIIGTHALIQQEVDIPNLALAVVDEQHRFGVEQRAALRGKGQRPHMLAMSATPIPRSLALTLYGDLEISTIDQMPLGREKIRTRWVQPDQRDRAYDFIRKEVKDGRQAFIVFSLIEESEVLQARAAVKEHERLSKEIFPDLRLGLLHGRMPVTEKQEVMEQFQRGEINILVSTPVIEVGIDVPNASVMLIDGANRFGLAQLHQFRGRVGRGQYQSYCLLLADEASLEARERLRVLERTNDGFIIAEEDLNLRGPGDYIGTRQSGLPSLQVATLQDRELLTIARREASLLLDSDPGLEKKDHVTLGQHLKRYSAGVSDEIS